MQNTLFGTLPVPQAAQNVIPSKIAQAAKVPMRVVVKNRGATLLLLADDASALNGVVPTPNTFELDVNENDVIVLAPDQKLLCVASGGTGVITFAASDAIPIV